MKKFLFTVAVMVLACGVANAQDLVVYHDDIPNDVIASWGNNNGTRLGGNTAKVTPLDGDSCLYAEVPAGAADEMGLWLNTYDESVLGSTPLDLSPYAGVEFYVKADPSAHGCILYMNGWQVPPGVWIGGGVVIGEDMTLESFERFNGEWQRCYIPIAFFAADSTEMVQVCKDQGLPDLEWKPIESGEVAWPEDPAELYKWRTFYHLTRIWWYVQETADRGLEPANWDFQKLMFYLWFGEQSVYIDEITLLADSSTAAEEGTWGKIKSLYR
jgi:hypothetical protein